MVFRPGQGTARAHLRTTSDVGDLSRACEEAPDEAILDTGASRTVIGSRRVPGLIKALHGVRVKRAPSSCVFKFGNNGTLQSQEALYLPRKGKGWLRVEIVPGSTPFLLSNAVVEGMKGVIDSFRGKLWFHGARQELELRKVRKRLICVRDLLNVDFEDEKGEVFISQSQMEETRHAASHHVHDTRIQNEETTKETADLQHPTDLTNACHVAHETAQAIATTQPETISEKATNYGISQADGPDLSPGRSPGRRIQP